MKGGKKLMEKPDLSGLRVGCPVVYVDPVAVRHEALVTAVWGDPAACVPCINLVYIDSDETKQDPYGRQISRQTSLCHRSVNPAHGQYFMMPGDTANPVQPASQK
jgi:hypothetical protein